MAEGYAFEVTGRRHRPEPNHTSVPITLDELLVLVGTVQHPADRRLLRQQTRSVAWEHGRISSRRPARAGGPVPAGDGTPSPRATPWRLPPDEPRHGTAVAPRPWPVRRCVATRLRTSAGHRAHRSAERFAVSHSDQLHGGRRRPVSASPPSGNAPIGIAIFSALPTRQCGSPTAAGKPR